MGQHRGIPTSAEQARITDLQDLLIARFVEHREAVAERQEERVKTIEAEIDSLLREKEAIEKWAVAGSAEPPPNTRERPLRHRIGYPMGDRASQQVSRWPMSFMKAEASRGPSPDFPTDTGCRASALRCPHHR